MDWARLRTLELSSLPFSCTDSQSSGGGFPAAPPAAEADAPPLGGVGFAAPPPPAEEAAPLIAATATTESLPVSAKLSFYFGTLRPQFYCV